MKPSLLDLKESRLLQLIRMVFKETHRIYDFTIADRMQDDDENQQDLEEYLYDLGLLDEGLCF